MSPARRSRLPQRRPLLVVLLLSLVIFLPALPMQPAAAAPGDSQPDVLSAQETPDPLIAFLRQGDLWLMNADGSDQRQITDYPEGVTQYSWSPSGRYILLQHGGRFWHWKVGRADEAPEARLTLYDAMTGELRDIMAASTDGQFPKGRFPSWAQDADELLMEVAEGNGSYSIVRIGLDGAIEPVSVYSQRQTCGGPDGPMTIMVDLLWVQELGSPFAREAYQGIVWWADGNIAYINPECGNGISLDLETSTMVEYPRTVWLTASNDGRILVQDYALVGGGSAGVFDPATGTTMPIAAGDVFAWSPDREIVSTTVTRGADSAFTSDFDDVPNGYTDNTVEIWRADGQGGDIQHVATLDVQGTGILGVASDGAIIVGTVDNPTALMDVDESRYSEYSPGIYAEHQKILRIHTGGEVTELATNAYRPRLQPAGMPGDEVPASGEEDPSLPTVPPAAPATVTQNENTDQSAGASGEGWIAYVGEDGNIWLMQPDGSQQTQVTTDGAIENGLSTYDMPAWSHDGSMLTFMEYGYGDGSGGIWVLREGALTLLPNTGSPCFGPAFSADNQRVLYTCAQNATPGDPVPSDLSTNPLRGFVTSSKLDGSDQRIEVPYSLDGSGVDWASDGKAMHYGRRVDVRPSDGMVMVVYSGFHKAGVHLFAPDSTRIGTFDVYNDEQWLGPYDAHLTPDGETIIATVCTSGCMPPYENPIHNVLLLDLDGNPLGRWSESGAGQISAGVDMAPDGLRVVTAFRDGPVSDDTIFVIQESMAQSAIGVGSQPAWQPNPGFTPQVPASSSGSQAIQPSGSGAGTSNSSGESINVPDAFLGTWDGRGTQVNPSVEWPVTIDLTGGGTGSVVGTSAYPNDGCGGDLLLQDATTDTIVLVENLTYGLDACTNGGTITLGRTSDTTLSFDWAGIRKDGSASSATGSLTRSQPSADTSAPAPVAASVPEGYVASWSGTGVQANPAVEWPVTIRITGGGPGAVVGTSDYPEQSCGGNLILQDVTSDSIVLLEQLTYGQNACTDGGTITLSGLDAVAVQFAWTGTRSDGSGSSASGTLYRPDSTSIPSDSAPSDQALETGDTMLKDYWVGTTWTGVGEQESPDSEWTITVTFTGGRPGEVIGTVEYPTLGCGGELVLTSIIPDEYGTFEATEHITYGQDNCIDGGSFWFSSAEGARRLLFRWESPAGPTTAEGILDLVEPGAASEPADQSTETATPADELPATEEPVETDASGGGPPSIYDAPAGEEVVPIEPEG